ncbi:MAG: hypothetical protein KF846_13300 [Cyclobacteriaceae bacterium]|nr:hypothetical protein [Cyclobacteriaceae bacterium]
MSKLLLFVSIILLYQDIPYKPDDEFSIRMDLKFKLRPQSASNTVNVSETMAEYQKRNSTNQLPYLILYVNVKHVNQGEIRMRVLRDGKNTINNKKIELDKEFKIEVGFTDDAKDKISGYEHIIYFMDADKKDINRIVITIDPNGDYFVNGQKRGRL